AVGVNAVAGGVAGLDCVCAPVVGGRRVADRALAGVGAGAVLEGRAGAAAAEAAGRGAVAEADRAGRHRLAAAVGVLDGRGAADRVVDRRVGRCAGDGRRGGALVDGQGEAAAVGAVGVNAVAGGVAGLDCVCAPVVGGRRVADRALAGVGAGAVLEGRAGAAAAEAAGRGAVAEAD